jgi:hypothetical protein
MMLVADLLHSCTHEDVAGAAVASIGGDFAMAMRSEAVRSGLSVGALMASVVSGFVLDATEHDWRQLTTAMAGEDQPLLSGLRAIAERTLRKRAELARSPVVRRAHVPVPHAAAYAVTFCSLG